MAMDRPIVESQKDVVCMGAQSLIRLVVELRECASLASQVGSDEGYRRLSAVCDDIQALIRETCTDRYPKHMANELEGNGEVDRFRKALAAHILEWGGF